MTAYDTTIDADSPTVHWKLGEAYELLNPYKTAVDRKLGIVASQVTGVQNEGLVQWGAPAVLTQNNSGGTSLTVSRFQTLGKGLDVASGAFTFNKDLHTLEAWIKPFSVTDGYGDRYILAFASIGLYINTAGKVGVWHSVSSSAVNLVAPSALGAGAHHVAVTLTAGTRKLFVDGAQVATDSIGTVDTAGALGLGYYPGFTTPLGGLLQEVAIYGTALTGTRVTAHYTSGWAATTPVNTVAPTVTVVGGGSPAVGSVLRCNSNGTWTNSPTYQYQWFRKNFQQIPIAVGAPSASTDYTLLKSDSSRGVFCRVIATASGGAQGYADSTATQIRSTLLPWKSSGNPWTTPLPGGVSIDVAGTSALQTQLQTWYTAGKAWAPEGGYYGGPSYSSIIHYVDSSMTRTPWVLVGGSAVDPNVPKYPQVQNSTDPKEHMAWTFAVKNGGVPTPPGGFAIAPGGDRHLCVFSTDTFEYWEMWLALYNPWWGTPTHADYVNQYVFGFGGYIPDVRDVDGFWSDYVDANGNKVFHSWGAMATGLPYFGFPTIHDQELVNGSINHAIGVLLPGTNGGHRYPAQRTDGSGATISGGGIWRLKPSVNIAGLATTGDTASDLVRNMILTAAQTYGLIVVDTTGGQGLSLRFEAETEYGQAYAFNANFDTMMKAVNPTDFELVSASYRPTGAPQIPKIHDFQEDFNDATGWTLGGAFTFTGGQGRAVVSGTAATANYTADTYDWTDSYMSLELVQAAGTYLGLSLSTPDFSYFAFVYDGTNLTVRHYVASVGVEILDASVVYNSTNHRWLWLEETAGVMYAKTSATYGGTRTTQFSIADVFAVDAVYPGFYVQGTTGTALIDNINLAPPINRTAADTVTVSDAATGIATHPAPFVYSRHVRDVGARVAITPRSHTVSLSPAIHGVS